MTFASDQPVDVLAVGHALVDVLSPSPEALIESEGLIKGSMQLIDDDRARQLYQRMGPGSESSGGSAANTVTGVVACGGTASFIGTVAYDQLGEIFAHDIKAAGVRFDTPPVPASSTGRCLILVTPDGERTMNTSIGAATQVSIDAVNEADLRSARITYVEGYLCDSRFPVADWHQAAKVIHDAGNLFSFTLSDSFCVARHRDQFMDLLDGAVDICFGNEDEVKELFQLDDLDECLRRLADRCHISAITSGARGSVVMADGQRYEVPAEKVDVVDTTGAGDLYAAGFLAALAQGRGPEDCGRLASRAAGAVVSQMGARLAPGVRPSLP